MPLVEKLMAYLPPSELWKGTPKTELLLSVFFGNV